MKINCPTCSHPVEAASASEGEVRCPACGAKFQRRPTQTETLEGPPRTAERTRDLSDGPAGPATDVERPTVAGYEILGELGRGGMGVVYKARQLSLNRLVALKMILAGEHAGAEAVNRFRREAESVARLQHPVVVQIHEIGEQGGRPFLSLEYVGGGALAEKLGGQPQPIAVAARLVERLARAMHFAHERGVIHRDLKPANVLLTAPEGPTRPDEEEATTPWGEPKITDFGLAKRLGADARQTQSGAIVGTPGYMAPEQARGKVREVGPATDVYALGAILYECLTGRPPFKGDGPLDTVVRLLNEEPVPATRLRADCPRDLETICLKCLRKEPAKRYASAGELADDLRRFLRGEPIQARPLSRLERGTRWLKRQRVATMVLAGGVVALAVALWFRPGPEAPVSDGPIIEARAAPGPEPKPGPGPDKDQHREAGPPVPKARALPADLALVPRTALGFASIRLLEVDKVVRAHKLGRLFSPLLGPEARTALETSDEKAGISTTDVERITWVVLRPRSLKAFSDLERLLTTGKSELTIYRMVRPYDREKVLRSLGPRRQTKQYEGHTCHFRDDTEPRAVYFAGKRVLVDGHPEAVRFLLERLPAPTSPGPLNDALHLAAEGPHLVVASNPPAGALAEWGDQFSTGRAKFRPHAEALAEARTVALSVSFLSRAGAKKARALRARPRLHLYFADEASARPGQAGAEAALALARKELKEKVKEMGEGVDNPFMWLLVPREAVKALHQLLAPVERSLAKAKVERNGHAVRAQLLVSDVPEMIAGAVGMIKFGGQMEYKENLGKLWQALRDYDKKHGRLPPPAIYSKDGRPLLSWRVLLLPHLGEEKLFKQFRLDEVWDSDHNKVLLEQIPDVYNAGTVLGSVPHGTLIQVVVGPDTLFEGRQGVPLKSVPWRTTLLAEGRRAVPWTKPEDLTYQVGGPLPELGGAFPEGFYLLSAGGRVRFLPRTTSERELRGFLTRDDRPRKAPP
jgi:serine/threonine protein kinase